MKICVFTGTRAEYGLLYWLMNGIKNDPQLELQLVVTAMHLSPEFGLTYKQIEADDFYINKKIEVLLSGDTSISISKSMGLGLISYSEALEELKPDWVVILGDRTEMLVATAACLIAGVPVAHIAGGEVTEGAYDDAIRHSITKMSTLHFTAAEQYKKRVIQLGEQPDRVFNIGAIGLDNIKKLKLLNLQDFEKEINFKLNKRNLLITYHPVTLEDNSSAEQFGQILSALEEFEETNFIFTKPNSDKNGRVIIQMIDDYVAKNKSKAVAFTSMGQLRYLSALSHVDAIVGNSSSGIAEAPALKTKTINIGDRQKGRIFAESIITCKPEKDEIKNAIIKAITSDFDNVANPYGDGDSSEKIINIIKNFKNKSLKKQFFDINQTL